MNKNWPLLGCGVGLRTPHYTEILKTHPKVDWFEAISENFMDSGGRPLFVLQEIRRHYPIALHGVSLSIGSVDPLNQDYLNRLRTLVNRIDPFIVSDHLCWTGVDQENLHDLLPLPFTQEAIDFVAHRIEKVQDFLKRRILIENVSSYVTYKNSALPEWEFLVEVAKRSGCGILLDLNNIYVNSKNHGFNPIEYIEHVPRELVGQFHLAGHTDMGKFLFDTHSAQITDPVWKLYEKALELYGQVTTLIEWDENIPDLKGLISEADKANVLYHKHPHASVEVARKNNFRNEEKSSFLGPSLYEIQKTVKDFIQPEKKKSASQRTGFLNTQGGEDGEIRLSVYANGYVARIHESLSETYETISHLLGKEKFMNLTTAYARAYPSQDYNLNHVGRDFSRFIHKSMLSQEYPFLEDLAFLEWELAQSFHSFDEASLDLSAFAAIPQEEWENLRINFQPSVKIVRSKWPIHEIWMARKTPLTELNIDLQNKAEEVLISRKGVEVFCEKIGPSKYEMIQGFLNGKKLGEVCELLIERFPEEPISLQDWFAEWARRGMIRSLSQAESYAD